jgi:hypothetical protein
VGRGHGHAQRSPSIMCAQAQAQASSPRATCAQGLRQEPKSILGPAQPMTQDYFGFCRKRGPRIVGSWRAQAPCMRCGCAKPPSRRPKCQVCVGVCTTLRQDPSVTWAQGMCPAPNSSPNTTCPHVVFLRY